MTVSWHAALHYSHLSVAAGSCPCSIWHHAGGQSHKPWEKQCFVHIRLQSIRFPLPPQLPSSLFLRPEGYLERAPQPACPSLLGAQLVVRGSSLQDSGPSFYSQMRQTDGWLVLTTLYCKWERNTGTRTASPICLSTPAYVMTPASIMSSSSWCIVHLGAEAD